MMSLPAERIIIRIAVVLAGVGLLLLLGYGLRAQTVGPLTGGEAPPFTLQLFNGGKLSLADLRGRVVIVNFWASWCPPCRTEAPLLEKAWQTYKDQGVVFVGVNYMDTEPEARAFLAEFGITYPNGPDLGSRISQAYRIRGVPETFFIAKDGRIADLHIGPISESRLTGLIEDLLRQSVEPQE